MLLGLAAPPAPREPCIRIARNIAGLLPLWLGIAGLFPPLLQRILFPVMGLGLIDVPRKRRTHNWLERRVRCSGGVAVRHQRTRRTLRADRHRRRAGRPR